MLRSIKYQLRFRRNEVSSLSIIVPIYNSEAYLIGCVNSLILQNKEDVEIILVDDGSTDDSGIICDDFHNRDSRVKVIHWKNHGKLLSRNKGVEESTGKYITFVDSDDWVDKNAYSSFDEYMNDGIDCIIFRKQVEKTGSYSDDYNQEINNIEYSGDKLVELLGKAIWDKTVRASGISHSLCDKIFRRELIEKSCFNAVHSGVSNCGEDAVVVYPGLIECNRVVVSTGCFYHYRQHVNNVPNYFKEDSFFDEMYKWYCYLKGYADKIPNGMEQLDFQYLDLLEERKRKYGRRIDNDRWLFPFDKVLKDSEIVIYGAGDVGATYYWQIKRIKYAKIKAWVDKNYSLYDEMISDVITIFNLDFDYIVIAIDSITIRDSVKKWLIDCGIDGKKIVE